MGKAKDHRGAMSYLPHDGQEFTGQRIPDAEETAQDAIRAIMTEQKREISRRSLPELAPPNSGVSFHKAPELRRRRLIPGLPLPSLRNKPPR